MSQVIANGRQSKSSARTHVTLGVRVAILAIVLLFLPSIAKSQGQLYTGIAWKYTPAGAFPASGAAVTVCSTAGTGAPCTPKISLFSDSGLTLPVTNPLPVCTSSPQFGCIDGLGNFSFYMTPGAFTYTVTGAGLSPYGPIPANTACIAGVTCLTNPSAVLLTLNAGVTSAGPDTFTGLDVFKNINNFRYSSGFPGADFGIKTNNCIADLPANGGVCLGAFEGAQSTATAITNSSTKPMELHFGAGIFSTTAQLDFSNVGAVTLFGVGTSQGSSATTGTIIRNASAGALGTTPYFGIIKAGKPAGGPQVYQRISIDHGAAAPAAPVAGDNGIVMQSLANLSSFYDVEIAHLGGKGVYSFGPTAPNVWTNLYVHDVPYDWAFQCGVGAANGCENQVLVGGSLYGTGKGILNRLTNGAMPSLGLDVEGDLLISPVRTYSTGTVTVANGNATVTGAGGASWTAAMVGQAFTVDAQPGAAFCPNNADLTVATVTPPTTLTLSCTWQGTGAGGLTYVITDRGPAVMTDGATGVWHFDPTITRLGPPAPGAVYFENGGTNNGLIGANISAAVGNSWGHVITNGTKYHTAIGDQIVGNPAGAGSCGGVFDNGTNYSNNNVFINIFCANWNGGNGFIKHGKQLGTFLLNAPDNISGNVSGLNYYGPVYFEIAPSVSGVNTKQDFIIHDQTDGSFGNIFWRDSANNALKIGGATAVPTFRITPVPGSAGGVDLGTGALPFGNLWLGTAATNNFKFQPATTTGARIITIADPLSPTTVGMALTIASGTSAMTTALIAGGACGSTVTTAATGVLTTDIISVSHNVAVTNGNGGILILNWWPTAGNVNFNYCNPGAGNVTPTAMTINWTVVR